MKKLLTILGGICAVILVVIIVVLAIFIPHAIKLNHEAVAYVQSDVPKIVEHWNAQELVDRATPELLSEASRDELDRLFEMFLKLGALKHLDTPEGSVYSSTFTGSGTTTIGNYAVQADFEKGQATIKVQLLRVGDTWKINGFHVSSELFLPPKT